MKNKSKFEKLTNFLQDLKKFFSEANLGDLSKLYKKILKRLPDISHLKNIVFFSGVATLFIFVLFAQRFNSLYEHLPSKPTTGGVFVEGMVGNIKQLNPLYTPTNSAEESVASILFSGLTKNTSNKEVIGNLAESWEVSKDKQTYTFKLREDIYWHDGERLDADDVFFTFQTIQNPDANSPRLATWKDVKVEVIDERNVAFVLPSPLASFIYLTDVPILPEHILSKVPVSNLRAAEFSTNPIGSGPYIFSEIKMIKDTQEVHLIVNEEYYQGRPFIDKVVMKSFPNYGSLTHAYNRKDVMSVSRLRPYDVNRDNYLPKIRAKNLVIPEYDVVFYNLNSEILKDKLLREAISLSIDKKKIVKEVYYDEAVITNSALLPGYLGYNTKLKQEFNIDAAKKKLEKGGYKLSATKKLTKENNEINLRLVSVDEELKRKEASILAKMIGELGITVNVENYPIKTYIEDMIRPRNYDLLLTTQNLGPDSDIYTFYHTNMATDPGLNLSGIKNRQIDKYLEDARTSADPKLRASKYSEISKFINNEFIATYICWPSYLYGISSEVKGVELTKIINPKDRFWNIEDWYIVSERDY